MSLISKQITREAGMRVKKIRQELRLTPMEMKKRLGLTSTSYYKIERGEQFFSWKTLHHFLEDTGLSSDWLLFGKGPKYFKEKDAPEKLAQQLEEQKMLYAADTTQLKKDLDTERKQTEILKKQLAVLEVKKTRPVSRYHPDLNDSTRELLEYFETSPTFFHEIMLLFHKHKSGSGAGDKQEKG